MREALATWLAERRRQPGTIVELRRIATGNSRAMWYVALDDGSRYVTRIEQGGVFGTSSVDEFRFMQAAATLGCPVAPVRWMEPTGDVIGQPFFVMDFIDGTATGRDDRSMSEVLARDFVRRLDELHRTDWASQLGAELGTQVGSGSDATVAQLDRWLEVYRAAADDSLPLLEEGATWLRHNAPTAERVGIVHGDPGPGNMVHDTQRVIAFTDWEFSHIGDPAEDWAYLVTMRGAKTMPPDVWLALFREIAGIELAARDLHYWSVFNFFKGACANLTCRRAFTTINPVPNMAIIGTALHQTYMRRVAMLIGDAP